MLLKFWAVSSISFNAGMFLDNSCCLLDGYKFQICTGNGNAAVSVVFVLSLNDFNVQYGGLQILPLP